MTCCQAYSDATTAGSSCYATRLNYSCRAEHQLHGRHPNNFTPCLPVTDLILLFFLRKRVPLAGIHSGWVSSFASDYLGHRH